MRALALAILLVVPGVSAASRQPCTEMPEPSRWQHADPPDPSPQDFRVTVHRGAANLAPENTIPAFEYAIAYDVEMIEVDVQQTLDGGYVVLHDYLVDEDTDGTGYIQTMTFDQATSLNAADNNRWRGSEYDPTLVPSLEQVLQLAESHRVGINFDLKESVTNAAGVALLARRYPEVFERSIFQPYVPVRAESILAAAPDAKIMFNAQFETAPAMYYAIAAEYDWFGSDLEWYPAEAVAAIHDACARVQPNVYSDDKAREASDLRGALARGSDGAMVNNPDVAADVLDEPVATALEVQGAKVCLVGHHGLGLPKKPLDIDGLVAITARGGCVDLPQEWTTISFAGDGSALPAAR